MPRIAVASANETDHITYSIRNLFQSPGTTPKPSPKALDQRTKKLASKELRIRTKAIVGAIVGPDKTHFALPQHTLAHHSLFFRGALRGTWKNSEKCTVDLREEDPEHFKYFADWIKTGKLRNYPRERELFWPLMIRLWILGDFLLAESFKLLILHILIKETFMKKDSKVGMPKAEDINHAYAHSSYDSHIRAFLVDLILVFAKPFDATWREVQNAHVGYFEEVAERTIWRLQQIQTIEYVRSTRSVKRYLGRGESKTNPTPTAKGAKK